MILSNFKSATDKVESAVRVVHRTLSEKLKTFSTAIQKTIDDVDKGASIDMMQDLGHQFKLMEGTMNKLSGTVTLNYCSKS